MGKKGSLKHGEVLAKGALGKEIAVSFLVENKKLAKKLITLLIG